jgi:hypothetical protein
MSNGTASELLKVAQELRDMAELITADQSRVPATDLQKTAQNTEDFSIGKVGGEKRSTDPFMDFLFG